MRNLTIQHEVHFPQRTNAFIAKVNLQLTVGSDLPVARGLPSHME